jgi:hypothetical protein
LHIPQLIPGGFKISPLPSKISSFIIMALQTIESSWIQSRKKPMRNGIRFGDGGSGSAPRPALTITLSSLSYNPQTPSSSSVPFLPSIAWQHAGAICGKRLGPVVLSTVRNAASNLAAAFWGHFQQSPMHIQGSTQLLPTTVRALLKALNNADLPAQCQKAITPKLLRKFFKLLASGTQNSGTTAQAHTADLVLGVFFFTVRSCKYTRTAKLGRTKHIRMGCIVFRTHSHRVLSLLDPELLSLANYITIVFENQKNGKKMDARMQRRFGLSCPPMGIGCEENYLRHPRMN